MIIIISYDHRPDVISLVWNVVLVVQVKYNAGMI